MLGLINNTYIFECTNPEELLSSIQMYIDDQIDYPTNTIAFITSARDEITGIYYHGKFKIIPNLDPEQEYRIYIGQYYDGDLELHKHDDLPNTRNWEVEHNLKFQIARSNKPQSINEMFSIAR